MNDQRVSYRNTFPTRFIASSATIAIILLLILLLFNQLDPQARAAREMASYRQAQIDQALTPVDLFIAAGWRILPLLIVAGGTILAGLLAWRRWGWRESIYADKTTAAIQADRQQYPARLHTLHYHNTARVPSHASPPAQISSPASDDQADNQSAPALTLPDASPLAEIVPQLKPGQLCYGQLPNAQPLILSFAQAYHALAAGDTRTGKSNYLDAIITQLHYQARRYDLRLLIGDFKREMAATWERSPLVGAVEVDPQTIAELLEELAQGEDGILQRYDRFKELGEQEGRVIRNLGDYCRVTSEQPRITFAVVDEMNALIEAAGRKSSLESALKIVLQIGAGAGIYVLGGAQYLNAATFGRDGSKQFTTRAIFGAYDHTAARMLFGGGKLTPEYRELLTGQPGRGLIRTAGQAEPIPFQALRCDESDILTAIALLTDNQPTMPNLRTPAQNREMGNGKTQQPTERLNRPGTAPERAEPAFTNNAISPEIAQIIRNLTEQGWGKTKVIETLFNVKRGGSERWKTLSAAYDHLMSEAETV